MLWPIVLPIKITFWMMLGFIVVGTLTGALFRHRPASVFIKVLGLAAAAFIPSCAGIQYALDRTRFGRFDFPTYQQVTDERARRYLPTGASQIQMWRHANGYRARYQISPADFDAYLSQWRTTVRDEAGGEHVAGNAPGMNAFVGEQTHEFADLGWPPLAKAMRYESLQEPDGGGATYYFDRDAGLAYQRTGYW